MVATETQQLALPFSAFPEPPPEDAQETPPIVEKKKRVRKPKAAAGEGAAGDGAGEEAAPKKPRKKKEAPPPRVYIVNDLPVLLGSWLERFNILSPEELRLRLQGTAFSFDLETNGLHWNPLAHEEHKSATGSPCASRMEAHAPGEHWADRVVGASIACPPRGVAVYIPFEYEGVRYEGSFQAFRDWLWELVSDPETTVIGHNLKFDLHMMGMDPYSARFRARIEDTSVMVHLLDSRMLKSLEVAEQTFLGTTRKRDHLADAPGRSASEFIDWPFEKQRAYAGDDAIITYELWVRLWGLLEKWELTKLFRKEMKYMRLLWTLERRGLRLDFEANQEQLRILSERITELEERELWPMVGHRFNWGSTHQLSHVIYEELGVPKPKNPYADADGVDRSRFADRGQYNKTMTSAFILMEKVHHPIGGLILALRETKLLANRLQRWERMVDEEPALHTNLKMTGTRTGRLSSAGPELQNVPSDTRTRATQAVYSGDAYHRSGAYNLRKPLVARPGHIFLSVDHKQQEMRLFGIHSGDERMLESLRAGSDIHRDIAYAVWGVRDDLHREWSKTIGFGLIYGMTTGSLQHRLNKTKQEANQIADQYQNAYPRIRPYMQEVVRGCQRSRYVRYWSGRIWREDDPDHMYKAVNAIVQGGAADLLSVAGMRIASYLEQHGGGWLALPIHDEWVLEIEEDALEELAPAMVELMSLRDIFDIPFPADCKVGFNMGEMHKYVPGHTGHLEWAAQYASPAHQRKLGVLPTLAVA